MPYIDPVFITNGSLFTALTISLMVIIAVGAPSKLVFIPLTILIIRLPLFKFASRISESLSIIIWPSNPRSWGDTIPSKLEKDNCSPSIDPSKIIFTIILSVEAIVTKSSPESFVVTSYE